MNIQTVSGHILSRSRQVVAFTALLILIFSSCPALSWEIDTTHKWAWSATVGWVNHRATQSQAAVYADHLEGYSWAENIGWIRLGTYTGGGTHTYPNTTSSNYGVNNNGSGNLSGFGWSANAGWINFSPSHGGVSINPATGDFSGHAWSENAGWIKFAGTAQDSTAYKVKYSITPLPPTYTVTYDSNGATGGNVPVDANSPYMQGAAVTVLDNTGGLVQPGFAFNGWNTAAGGGGTQYAPGATFNMPALNIILYAQWSSSSVTISPTQRIHAPDTVSGQGITITTGSATTWTASSGAAWITVTGGATGTGSGTVTYELDANTSPNLPRTGTISIADKLFTITQGTYHWQLLQGTGAGCEGRITGGPYFIEAAGQDAPQPLPPDTVFPWGLFGFRIVNVPSAGQVTVTFTMTYNIPAGSVFYNYSGGAYTACSNAHGLDDGDDTFTLNLTDGGQNDQDGTIKGEILYQGGLDARGANSIPTLSEWGIIILGLLMLVISLARIKRQRNV